MREIYEPTGTKFFDKASDRQMMLVHEDQPYAGWIAYKHPDGQWVTLRQATDADISSINSAVVAAHHGEP